MGTYTICDIFLEPVVTCLRNEAKGVESGFHDLDALLGGGFHDGMLYVLASRPGMGKSTLALNMILNMLSHSKKITYFSTESTMNQLLKKMILISSHIEPGTVREYSDEELDAIDHAAAEIAQKQLIINDDTWLEIDDLREIMRDSAGEGTDMIIIDYLQLMLATHLLLEDYFDSRDDEMEYICRSLKALAKELDIPILVLSQLSKNIESRDDKQPLLSDFIEKTGMDAYADVVMFLYRDEFYNLDSERRGIADVNVVKNHLGRQGKCQLIYIPQLMKFVNLVRS